MTMINALNTVSIDVLIEEFEVKGTRVVLEDGKVTGVESTPHTIDCKCTVCNAQCNL